jgi:hypothetical protein
METKSSVKLTTVGPSAPGSGGGRASRITAPNPEVAEKKPRRRFTANTS